MKYSASNDANFIEIIQAHVERFPQKNALTFLPDHSAPIDVSYEALDTSARAIASVLQERCAPGARALLLYPTGLEFVQAFLGCLYAGVIAVPAPVARNTTQQHRVALLARDADVAVVCALSEKTIGVAFKDLNILCLPADTLKGDPSRWRRPEVSPDQTIFLQYTSGSTNIPKGVMVSHRNLLDNQQKIQLAFGQREDSVVVGWLPLFHDMGLIGNLLHTLWLGAHAVLMSPEAFVRNPRRWLQAITDFRGTISGGPNFGYRWCVSRIAAEDRVGLDLSSWEVAFNGAEQVRPQTIRDFIEAFEPVGFRASALKPCYGLAEATLIVSAVKHNESPRPPRIISDSDSRPYSSVPATEKLRQDCGSPLSPVLIVDKDGRSLGEGQEGEIWVGGDSVCGGYWRKTGETALVFGAQPHNCTAGNYLRTGDLGILSGGRLYVTGRLSETIIIRGRNYHPHDVEEAIVSSDVAFRSGGGVAFSLDDEKEELLIVVHEVASEVVARLKTIAELAGAAVASSLGLTLHRLVLVEPNSIPRTTSGKVQRLACRAAYLEQKLRLLAEWSIRPDHDDMDQDDQPAFMKREVILSAFRRALRLRDLGVEDDFLGLGGDSMAAIEAIGTINARLGCQLTAADLYDHPTVSALAAFIDAGQAIDLQKPEVATAHSSAELTAVQRGIWLDLKRGIPGSSYHIPVEIRLDASLDLRSLRDAWHRLLDQYEILRSVFRGDPDVRRHSTCDRFDWDEVSVSVVENTEAQKKIDRMQGAAATRPFDLDSGPLWRMRVFCLPDSTYRILLVVHHLIADGESLRLLISEWLTAYTAIRDGKPYTARFSPSYSIVLRKQLVEHGTPNYVAARDYWFEALKGFQTPFKLPADYESQTIGKIGSCEAILDTDLTAALASLGRTSRAGLFCVLLAGYATVLHRISGRNQVLIAVPISERDGDFVNVVGPCVRTVILKIEIDRDERFSPIVDRVRRRLTEAVRHRTFPLDELTRELNVSVPPGEFPFTTVSFNALSFLQGDATIAANFRHDLGLPARFDWNCYVIHGSGDVTLRLDFNAARFRTETISFALDQLKLLLAATTADPERTVVELGAFHATKVNVTQTPTKAASQSLAARFAAIAGEYGDLSAVRTETQILCYSDLYARAGAIAKALHTHSTSPLVGVLCDDAAGAISGLLGVLMAGRGYVPLDAQYPNARLADIVNDAELNTIVFSTSCYPRLQHIQDVTEKRLHPVEIESVFDNGLAEIPVVETKADSPAYLLYTSGTTGRPKGVLQTQANVAYYVDAYRRVFGITCEDRLSLVSSFAYDAGLIDIFAGLLSGSTLCCLGPGARNPLRAATNWINDGLITVFHCTPSFHRALLADGFDRLSTSALRLWVLGGEPVRAEDVKRHHSRFPEVPLVNLYGQTESSFNSYWTSDSRQHLARVTLGSAIDGLALKTLTDDGAEASVYERGEIIVESEHISSGYWKRPDETAEKFLTVSGKAEHRYRTGDWGRLLPDGTIEYLGRRDGMVKIRGYRVELEEINTHLRRIAQTHDAAVVAQNDGETLCGYLSSKCALDVERIRAKLLQQLPSYMVPETWVTLDVLPRIGNGKLDIAALPKFLPATNKVQRAPETELESRVRKIFAEVLGVEPAEPHLSLFALGGTSLKAMQILAQANKELGLEVTLGEFLEEPTVAGLIRCAPVSAPPLSISKRSPQRRPPSSTQRQLWTISQLSNAAGSYNLFSAYEWRGPLDVEKLTAKFNAAMKRHPALRTTFHSQDDGVQCRTHDEFEFKPHEFDISASADPLAEAQAIACRESAVTVELGKLPLLWVAVCRLGSNHQVVMVRLPHIIADGWSITVLLNEILSDQTTDVLPVASEDDEIEVHATPEALAYWRSKLDGSTSLTLDQRPLIKTFAGSTVSQSFSVEWAGKLRKLAAKTGVSEFVVLVALVKTLLYRYSRAQDITVGSALAHRERPEDQGRIGPLISLIALRDRIDGDLTFDRLVAQVAQTVRQAIRYVVPFDVLVKEIGAMPDPSRHPLFDVSITFDDLQHTTLAQVQQRLGESIIISPLIYERTTSKFDLAFSFRRTSETITLDLEHASWFKSGRATHIFGHLQQLVESITDEPELPIERLDLLTRDERKVILVDRNYTSKNNPADAPLHLLFDLQAARAPDRPAVICGDQRISYGELRSRADALATSLRSRGVRIGSSVVLCCDRSIEYVVGALAVLKAGGAYIPIDPDQPHERNAYILADAKASLLLTNELMQARYGFAGEQTLCIDGSLSSAAPSPDRSRRESEQEVIHNDDDAYIIYTSGTTGSPKGVVIEHKSVANLSAWHQRAFAVDQSARTWLFASISFDASVWELWPYLLAGATVHVIPAERRGDAEWLAAYARTHELTHVFVPTHLYEQWCRLRVALPSGIRLLTGGDRLRYRDEQGWDVWNNYGPTECTVVTTCCHLSKDLSQQITIGSPIDNVRTYILDPQGEPVPDGVAGEIYVGGAGLARGYLNQPDLTAKRFVSLESLRELEPRLYRTGDYGRYLADGTIEFVGRTDDQMKINGVRIELGEVEAALSEDPSVQEVAVTARPNVDGNLQLFAYLVPRNGPIDADKLFDKLSSRLSRALWPAAVFCVQELPRSAGGKVDRAALPMLDSSSALRLANVTPRNAIERTVVEACQSVLRIELVSALDNFFLIGGSSITAAQLAARLSDVLGTSIELRDVFDAPVLARLAQRIGLRVAESTPQTPASTDDSHLGDVLSLAQERLWFLDQLDPGHATYNVHGGLHLRGQLSVSALERSLARIIARHECLRMRFPLVDGEPQVEIQPSFALNLRVDEVSEYALDDYVREQALRPFDLSVDPLLRVRLLRLTPNHHLLLVILHHIIADGWSISVLMRDWTALYAAEVAGSEICLPELNLRYVDYAARQRAAVGSDANQQSFQYWREHLNGLPPLLDLPTDRPRPPVQSTAGARFERVWDASFEHRLQSFAGKHQASTFMVLAATFALLLSRYANQSDIAIGYPVHHREDPSLEPLVGLFANTLIIRCNVDPTERFSDLLRQVRERVLSGLAHQSAPFEQIVQTLRPERSLTHNPLFQVMISVQPHLPQTIETGPLESGLLSIERMSQHSVAAKVDLTLDVEQTSLGVRVGWIYSTALFDRNTIEGMSECFEVLLDAVIHDDTVSIAALPLLTAAKRQRAITLWGQGPKLTERSDLCVHELFEAQVARTPDAIAVVAPEGQYSFRALAQYAAQVAAFLRKRGVQPEEPIAVCMRRNVSLLATLLGIMKAGCAYVPLDPEYPALRIAEITADSRSRLLLTERSLIDRWPELSAEALCVREVMFAGKSQVAAAPSIRVLPDQLAYIIYTSGSTGKPRGVAITHANASDMLQWAATAFSSAERDGVLASSSVCFDLSVFEMFLPLTAGGTVLLAENALELQTLRDRDRVTLLNTVPSACQALIEMSALPNAVQTVNLAGEPLRRELVNAIYRYPQVTRVMNLYGPTEDTTYSTGSWITADETEVPSIGKPLDHRNVYVLDAALEPAPVGVPGEIYLGGAGLSRGYYNQPKQTAERFIPNSFAEAGGQRRYRTGDRARYRPDGSIEFLGRADYQVKLRGFRVELGEIEAALRAEPFIREAVVVVREDRPGEQRLVGYVVVDEDAEGVAPNSLRASLAEKVPSWLVPSQIVMLSELPLTPNGKVDRAALPDPNEDLPPCRTAPRSETELRVSEIWSELLGGKQPGAHDDFFQLGGHSLQAARCVARLRAQFGVDLPLRALFEHSTVATLAAHIDSSEHTDERVEAIVPEPLTKLFPLSFSQQRLWFLSHRHGRNPIHNMAAAVRIRGQLNINALEESLVQLSERHDLLRARISESDGNPAWRIDDSAPELIVRDATEADLSRTLRAEAERPFELLSENLLRAILLRFSADDHALLLIVHHLISDGWSMAIIARDWSALYAAAVSGEPSALPDLPLRYSDFSRWERERFSAAMLTAEQSYWARVLRDLPPLLALPTDRPRPATQDSAAAALTMFLPADTAGRVIEFGIKRGATLFMTVAAGLTALLARYSGQSRVAVGYPVAGRTRPELEQLVGLYINTLVLACEVAPQTTFTELLAQVRQHVLDAQEHQEVPLDKVMEAVQPVRDMAWTPLFQVLLSLQNAPSVVPSLPGLTFERVRHEATVTEFDLVIELEEMADHRLRFTWIYRSELFDRDTVERMGANLLTTLRAAVADPGAAVSTLLSVAEHDRVIIDWNATTVEYDEKKLVHELLAEQVTQTPDAIAVVAREQHCSYRCLHLLSNNIAWRLVELGAGPNTAVVIFADAGIERVAAMLGVLKAGAAWVPVDPNCPIPRLQEILEVCGAEIVLTQTAFATRLSSINAAIVLIDSEQPPKTYAAPPPIKGTREMAAYLIFTSGSTGRPKGVIISHAALSAYIPILIDCFALTSRDRVLQFAPFDFDLAVQDIITTLAAGATVVLVPSGLPVDDLAVEIERQAVSVMDVTPSLWRMLVQVWNARPRTRASNLRLAASGADVIDPTFAMRLKAECSGRVLNAYGPTETTITTCVFDISQLETGAAVTPVGRPIKNYRVYVLDDEGVNVPIGADGEVCIGGPCLSLGYIGQPLLTAERFRPDPYSSVPGARLYRTGDRARFRPDGNVELRGRMDRQVKLRGFRIELDEVSSAIKSCPEISDAAVTLRDKGKDSERLVAYIVARDGFEFSPSALVDRLRRSLPAHMVPAEFVRLSSLPLDARGKVDFSHLRTAFIEPSSPEKFRSPRSETEQRLTELWATVLDRRGLDVDANFFQSGGNSLLALQLVLRVSRVFNVNLPLRAFYADPTIGGVAAWIDATARARADAAFISQELREDIEI